MAQQQISEYIQQLNPQGYVNNREITNLPGKYLVKGSRNVMIVNKEKVSTRLGYKLVGAAKTKNKGHRCSCDWETSGDGVGQVVRNIRLNTAGDMEVLYGGNWLLFKQYIAGTRAHFLGETGWWDAGETLDRMLWVIGNDEVHSWSGGITEVASSTATTLTMKGNVSGTTISFVDNGGATPDEIHDSGNGFVVAGFQIGDKVLVQGSASNDGEYTIAGVTAGVLTLGANDELTTEAAGAAVVVKRPGATWGESRFLSAGSININGTDFAYTGGTDTATLTGMTAVPGSLAGVIVFQSVVVSSPGHLDGLKLDLIGMINNYIFYGSTISRAITISSADDYTDFTFTVPLRKPGEGFDMSTDSPPTAFVNDEDVMWISGRKNAWYKVSFVLAADQGSESITIEKLKTATGQGAQSDGVIIHIKNSVAFLSFEPTIDTLGNVQNLLNTSTAVPISYEIRDDLLNYNFTDAHGIFYQNQIFITLPREAKVLIYNTFESFWQPPQDLAIGRLALIDIDGSGTQVLCGHSAESNETYQLFAPGCYNDNGAPINFVAAFGYDNFGTRFTPKNADEFATELYGSPNTVVKDTVVYDYKGATAIRPFFIDCSDESIRFAPVQGGGFGENEIGSQPLGSLTTPIDDLSKIKVVNETTIQDFFERQRIFSCSSIDARFSIIAYGENVEVSDNIPTYLKR